jgi:hypothetical protein
VSVSSLDPTSSGIITYVHQHEPVADSDEIARALHQDTSTGVWAQLVDALVRDGYLTGVPIRVAELDHPAKYADLTVTALGTSRVGD